MWYTQKWNWKRTSYGCWFEFPEAIRIKGKTYSAAKVVGVRSAAALGEFNDYRGVICGDEEQIVLQADGKELVRWSKPTAKEAVEKFIASALMPFRP